MGEAMSLVAEEDQLARLTLKPTDYASAHFRHFD
jgi:hypothetical protein